MTSPAGTYLPPGATAPIGDPAGYYSGPNASAPTLDPAGTYTSPYELDRLVVVWKQTTPDNTPLSFTSYQAVADYYGVPSQEASIAAEYFAGYANVTTPYPPTLTFVRYANGQRPHLLGGNITSLVDDLPALDAINGPLDLTFDGFQYNANVNLAGATSFAAAAIDIRNALTAAAPTAARIAGSSIAAKSTGFTGYTDLAHLFVTAVNPGQTVQIGGFVSGNGLTPGGQIIEQLNGTPGGIGEYSLIINGGSVRSEPLTESYGLLTVGAGSTGAVNIGERLIGAGVPALTAIDAQVSANQWIVDNAVNLGPESMQVTAPTFTVEAQQAFVHNVLTNAYFEIQPNEYFGFNDRPSTLSYATGAAATALELASGTGALDSSPGGQHESIAMFMNTVRQSLDQFGNPVEFGTFQSMEPRLNSEFAAWADSPGGYVHDFLSAYSLTTPPAGSSLPVTDPLGTTSGPGASKPTPTMAGTFLSPTAYEDLLVKG